MSEKFIIKVEAPTYIKREKSDIPSDIIEKAMIPEIEKECLNTPSVKMEKFLVERLQTGEALTTEKLVNSFFESGIDKELEEYIKEVERLSDKIDWKSLEKDVKKNAKIFIEQKLKEFSVSEDKIQKIGDLDLKFYNSHGVSSVGENEASVARYQVIRSALDYKEALKSELSIEDLTRIFAQSTMTHEIGHKINDILGNVIKRIPNEWKNEETGDPADNLSERFAEFWGRDILEDDNSAEIVEDRKKLLATQVEKVWREVREYNKNKDEQFNPVEVFNKIQDRIQEQSPELGNLLLARIYLYGFAAAENYVFPFSEEQVKKAIIENETESNDTRV